MEKEIGSEVVQFGKQFGLGLTANVFPLARNVYFGEGTLPLEWGRLAGVFVLLGVLAACGLGAWIVGGVAVLSVVLAVAECIHYALDEAVKDFEASLYKEK
jgi:hypothetical protein